MADFDPESDLAERPLGLPPCPLRGWLAWATLVAVGESQEDGADHHGGDYACRQQPSHVLPIPL